MREKICSGDFSSLFKLHRQKMLTMSRLEFVNHQEQLTSHQVSVLLSVFSHQPPHVTESCLTSWKDLCGSDGLYESRTSFEDLNSSFHDGKPKHIEEFFDENNCVRKEWISWIYNKL